VIMALVTTASTAPMLRLLGISHGGGDLPSHAPHTPDSEPDPTPEAVATAAQSPDMSGKR
jgi:hypothetical protein